MNMFSIYGMQSVKYSFLVYLLTIALFKYVYCQTFSIDGSNILKVGESCRLICKTIGLSGAVTFSNDRSPRGTCLRMGKINQCRPVISGNRMFQNESTNETFLQIKSLNVDQDFGTWTCSHRDKDAPSKSLKIFDYEDVIVTVNQERSDIIQTKVCIYPIPKIKFKCLNSSRACEDIQMRNLGQAKCSRPRLQMFLFTCTVHSDCANKPIDMSLIVYNAAVFKQRIIEDNPLQYYSYPILITTTSFEDIKNGFIALDSNDSDSNFEELVQTMLFNSATRIAAPFNTAFTMLILFSYKLSLQDWV